MQSATQFIISTKGRNLLPDAEKSVAQFFSYRITNYVSPVKIHYVCRHYKGINLYIEMCDSFLTFHRFSVLCLRLEADAVSIIYQTFIVFHFLDKVS